MMQLMRNKKLAKTTHNVQPIEQTNNIVLKKKVAKAHEESWHMTFTTGTIAYSVIKTPHQHRNEYTPNKH